MHRVRSGSGWVVGVWLLLGWAPEGRAEDCNQNGREDALDLVAEGFGFPELRTIEAGRYVVDVVLAHLNDDGLVDLGVLDPRSPASVTPLLNQGDGTFSKGESVAGDGAPWYLAAADLWDDGFTDLITTDGVDEVLVFRGTGDGRLAAPLRIPAGILPMGITSGDLDGDGRVDLAVANQGVHGSSGDIGMGVTILWNREQGFVTSERISLGDFPSDLLAVDLDGDEDLDLVVCDLSARSPPVVLANRGDGTFTEPQWVSERFELVTVDAGDLNGDGRPELVFVGQERILVLQNLGNLEFVEGAVLGTSASDVTLADLSGDDRLDIVSASPGGGVQVYRNLGDLQFESLPGRGPGCFAVVALDVDRDGDLDVVGASGFRGVVFLENLGDGELLGYVSVRAGDDPQSIAMGDFDADGDVDAVVSLEDDEEWVYYKNPGDGVLEWDWAVPAPPFQPGDLAAGDVDDDGVVDLVIGGSGLRYRLGQVGSLRGPIVDVDPSGWYAVPLVADWNGDGHRDIIAYEAFSQALRIFVGGSNGTFLGPLETALPYPSELLAVDLDASGYLEILSIAWGGDSVFVVRRGEEGLLPAEEIPMPRPVLSLCGLDFDRDGDPDVALGVEDSAASEGSLRFLENREGTLMLLDELLPLPEHPSTLVAGDVDGNGLDDLVVGGPEDRAFVYLASGAGRFAEPVPFRTALSPDVNLADLDGDGILDILVLGYSEEGIAIHLNEVIPPVSLDLDGNGVPDECQRFAFHRGDPDADGGTNITDAIVIFAYLFLGFIEPVCLESADWNNDATVNITDGITLLMYLFQGGPPPAPPGPVTAPCGQDPDAPGSAGDLGCEYYPGCG